MSTFNPGDIVILDPHYCHCDDNDPCENWDDCTTMNWDPDMESYIGKKAKLIKVDAYYDNDADCKCWQVEVDGEDIGYVWREESLRLYKPIAASKSAAVKAANNCSCPTCARGCSYDENNCWWCGNSLSGARPIG